MPKFSQMASIHNTLFEIFIFCPKFNFYLSKKKFNFEFPRRLSIFRGWKTRENVAVLDFLAVDNFDFTRKIVKKNLGEKLVKMLGFCQNWILDKNLPFWIVCCLILSQIQMEFSKSTDVDNVIFSETLVLHEKCIFGTNTGDIINYPV